MRAGRLRFRLELQAPEDIRDDIGGVRQDWQTHATVWGDIVPMSGRELWQAQQIESRLSHRLTLRYTPALLPSWRIRLKDTARVFQPVSVRTLEERDRTTEVLAFEVVEA